MRPAIPVCCFAGYRPDPAPGVAYHRALKNSAKHLDRLLQWRTSELSGAGNEDHANTGGSARVVGRIVIPLNRKVRARLNGAPSSCVGATPGSW